MAVATRQRPEPMSIPPGMQQMPSLEHKSAADILTDFAGTTQPDAESDQSDEELTEEQQLARKKALGAAVQSVLEGRVHPYRYYVNSEDPEYLSNRAKLAHMMGSAYIIQETTLLDPGMSYQKDSFELQMGFMLKTGEKIACHL